MAVRLPTFKAQIGDPTTTLDGYICTLECGAMGLDVVSGGRINVWGGQLIPYTGRTPLDIIRKGTNLYNVDRAWHHWGQDLDVRNGYNWTSVISNLKSGYFVILQGDYDQFTYATRCQDSFTGGHAVILAPIFSSTGAVLMGDPLCKTWKYVSQYELRNYAQKLARQVYGSSWVGQVFHARIKPATVTAPHYAGVVTRATSLWNDYTKEWVYKDVAGPADNRIPVGTRLELRGVQFTKGGTRCYVITSGKYSKNYSGYYVPVANVKLGSRVN